MVHLTTGIAQPLPYTFDGQIRQLFYNSDNQLIIRLEKFLREEQYYGPPGSTMMYGMEPIREFKLFCLEN